MSVDENIATQVQRLEERVKELEQKLEETPTEVDPSDGIASDYPELNQNQLDIVRALREQEAHGKTYSLSEYRSIIRQYGGVSQKKTIRDYMETLVQYDAFGKKGRTFAFVDSRGEA